MSFRSVFIAIVIGFGLTLAGFLINRFRPSGEVDTSSVAFVRATGKCAECHSQQQFSKRVLPRHRVDSRGQQCVRGGFSDDDLFNAGKPPLLAPLRRGIADSSTGGTPGILPALPGRHARPFATLEAKTDRGRSHPRAVALSQSRLAGGYRLVGPSNSSAESLAG